MHANESRARSLPARKGIEHSGDGTLEATDAMGLLHLGIVVIQTAIGLALSMSSNAAVWFAGQVLLGFALMQWFIVLHEAGHMSLFRTRAFNVATGHLASIFALIPFASWRRVHGLHHVWTGWQDKDPTTAALTPRERSPIERIVVNVAWRTGLPLFSVMYRLGNYWNVPRLLRLFTMPRQRRAIVINAVVLFGFYGVVAAWTGMDSVLNDLGLAVLIGLALQDPIILSQHTHVPQPVSEGRRVEPLCGEAQLAYTRSLRFPRWFAQWVLMNFNAHELHHLRASVPGYRLARLGDRQPNEVDWWTWLRGAKRLTGAQFVFGNRDQTGFRL